MCRHFESAALQKQYGGQGCQYYKDGSLPFTGMDIGLVLLIAAILIAAGLVLRKT